MCVYIFTSMHMCVFIMYIHIFFFRELLAKHLPAHTVSKLPATPGHAPGPGLGDTGRRSSPSFTFQSYKAQRCGKRPLQLLSSLPLCSISFRKTLQSISPLTHPGSNPSFQTAALKSQSRSHGNSTPGRGTEPEPCLPALAETLAAKRQLWRCLLAHLALRAVR